MPVIKVLFQPSALCLLWNAGAGALQTTYLFFQLVPCYDRPNVGYQRKTAVLEDEEETCYFLFFFPPWGLFVCFLFLCITLAINFFYASSINSFP